MRIPVYQIDAFTDNVFGGNPAAVCPLDQWLDDDTLRNIALENNLSETAYFVPDGQEADYRLRWFTPTVEVDICGHATLATSHLILNRLEPDRDQVSFITRSGVLTIRRDGDLLAMDFPSRPPVSWTPPAGFADAVGGNPQDILASEAPGGIEDERNALFVFETAAEVRAISPDFAAMVAAGHNGAIVTAPSEDCDCVSRYFAPHHGIDEDPVTGSAHCTIIPYWSERLGKADIHARQISDRGGELFCQDQGERVRIAGRAVDFMSGEISL